MRRPFTDMDYYASFPAFTAIPQAKDNPETYGKKPLATGPYKFADYKPGSELKLVKNDQWDPNTDPGRIQAVDGWDFKFGQDTAKLENVIINDQGSAQTTLTYDNVSASSYRSISSDKDRLVTGTSPCTYMWFIDMTKIKELEVRQALGWAYPYEAAWKAGGEIQGLTRVPGTAILPPGTAGRVDYEALEGQDGKTTDPAKVKALLKQAGYAPGEYEIKFLFATDDDQAVAAKNEIVKGLEAGGFKATPIASTTETIRTDRTDYEVADQRPLQRLVLGLADRWFVVPGPVVRQPRRPRGHAEPRQLQGGGHGRPAGQDPRHHDSRGGRSGLGRVRQDHGDEVLPGGQHRLLRHGHDPRLQGRWHGERQRARHADVRPDVHHQVITPDARS